MNFNDHFRLEGQHAVLGASSYHWLNYSDDKFIAVYNAKLAVQRGTELHDLARRCIELGVKLPKTSKTLNMYVNDAIGYKMSPETVLYYSENCFGTADTISFRKNFLRIHDLKTGSSPTSMNQLLIYAALFCLEYKIKPFDISSELRIYQSDKVEISNPPSEDILEVVNKIVHFDKIIEQLKIGG